MSVPPGLRTESRPQWLIRPRDCSTNGEESRKAFALERRFFVHTRRLQTMTTVKIPHTSRRTVVYQRKHGMADIFPAPRIPRSERLAAKFSGVCRFPLPQNDIRVLTIFILLLLFILVASSMAWGDDHVTPKTIVRLLCRPDDRGMPVDFHNTAFAAGIGLRPSTRVLCGPIDSEGREVDWGPDSLGNILAALNSLGAEERWTVVCDRAFPGEMVQLPAIFDVMCSLRLPGFG
jgi:hypothetical protein